MYPARTASNSGSEGWASWSQNVNAVFSLKVSLEAGMSSSHSSNSPGRANQGTTDESYCELVTRAHWLVTATLRTSVCSGWISKGRQLASKWTVLHHKTWWRTHRTVSSPESWYIPQSSTLLHVFGLQFGERILFFFPIFERALFIDL